jgi:hypothetical protein
VDRLADGSFVVTWQGPETGSGFGIFARRYSSSGTPLNQFQVNQVIDYNERRHPSVAASPAGSFAVAWMVAAADGYFDIFARRFSSAGAPLGVELEMNAYTLGGQGYPAVTAVTGGDIVVSWHSYTEDGSGYGIFARHLRSPDLPFTNQFQVNTHTAGQQGRPAIAGAGNEFVVVWQSENGDGDGYGIFAQRFNTPPKILDIDGNGTIEPLTDGILILRYLFGFTDDSLVAGAIDELGCTRCESDAIRAYLDTLV